jgi:hypothetical protein
MSRFISQVVLLGATHEFNVVLLVPEWPSIRNKLGVADDVSEELANDERVKDLIDGNHFDLAVRLKV